MYNITNKQNENNLIKEFNNLVNDFYSKDMKTNIVDEGDYKTYIDYYEDVIVVPVESHLAG